MGEFTNFVVDWKARVAVETPYYIGALRFGGATFALEYYPDIEDLSVCFRPPCCLSDEWETVVYPDHRGVAYAFCEACDAKYALLDERSTLFYGLFNNGDETDPEWYQQKAMETYLTYWKINPLEAAILSHDFVAYMREFVRDFTDVPALPTIGHASYRVTWGRTL